MSAAEGIRQQFDELVRTGRPVWMAAARRILRSEADAEDVVQETLAAVWSQLNRRQIEQPAAYVGRAVVVNAIKRRSRRRLQLGDAALQGAAAPEAEPALDPMQLEQAIAGLPPAQQAVLRERFYVGLSFAAIGRNVGISTNTAASRCRYALAALRRRFNRET